MALDLQDLMLEAAAEVQETVTELMTELMEQPMKDALRLQWAGTSADQKEILKQLQPETYRRLMQMIEQ